MQQWHIVFSLHNLSTTALVDAYGADMGMVYIRYCCSCTFYYLCGYYITENVAKYGFTSSATIEKSKDFTEEEMPSFAISLIIPLLPAIIITAATVINIFVDKESQFSKIINFFGSAEISMILAVLIAIYVFGIKRGRTMKEVMDSFSGAIEAIAIDHFLYLGSGGAFKQIILDTGIGDFIAGLMQNTSVSPLIMAWLITAILRIATGTGVVSAITATGIVGPLIHTFDVNPVLMVLATAAW